jgi:hypothetical protein
VGGICSMRGRDEKCVRSFNWKTRREEITLECRRSWGDDAKLHVKK